MRLLLVFTIALLAAPAMAEASPPLCTPEVIETTLTGAGHELDEGVDLVRCGDVTGDGDTDACSPSRAAGPPGTRTSA